MKKILEKEPTKYSSKQDKTEIIYPDARFELSNQDVLLLLDLVENPPEPNEELIAAVKSLS